MKYLTKSLMQRFMSHMSEQLSFIQSNREDIEGEITYCKENGHYDLQAWYNSRGEERKQYIKLSELQYLVKKCYTLDGSAKYNLLQKMEKATTVFIRDAEWQSYYAYQDYLENRYDTFYRNKTKQAKQRLAKLVELQQAIRKQKSISGDSF